MTFHPVYNPKPKVEELSPNKNKLTYYLKENNEEIYAVIIIDADLKQNKIIYKLTKYNEDYLQEENIKFFLKTLFYLLLDLSFNNIQIINFPISEVYWNEYFEILKRFVDFKINFHTDELKVYFKFINEIFKGKQLIICTSNKKLEKLFPDSHTISKIF